LASFVELLALERNELLRALVPLPCVDGSVDEPELLLFHYVDGLADEVEGGRIHHQRLGPGRAE
jgi:hypothetical protein